MCGYREQASYLSTSSYREREQASYVRIQITGFLASADDDGQECPCASVVLLILLKGLGYRAAAALALGRRRLLGKPACVPALLPKIHTAAPLPFGAEPQGLFKGYVCVRLY